MIIIEITQSKLYFKQARLTTLIINFINSCWSSLAYSGKKFHQMYVQITSSFLEHQVIYFKIIVILNFLIFRYIVKFSGYLHFNSTLVIFNLSRALFYRTFCLCWNEFEHITSLNQILNNMLITKIYSLG